MLPGSSVIGMYVGVGNSGFTTGSVQPAAASASTVHTVLNSSLFLPLMSFSRGPVIPYFHLQNKLQQMNPDPLCIFETFPEGILFPKYCRYIISIGSMKGEYADLKERLHLSF